MTTQEEALKKIELIDKAYRITDHEFIVFKVIKSMVETCVKTGFHKSDRFLFLGKIIKITVEVEK